EDGIDSLADEVCDQRSQEEGARRALAKDEVARLRWDVSMYLREDLLGSHVPRVVGLGTRHVVGLAEEASTGSSTTAERVDDECAALAGGVEQGGRLRDRVPTFETALRDPVLHRLEQRETRLANDSLLVVDHEHCRPRTETEWFPLLPARRQVLPVALREE